MGIEPEIFAVGELDGHDVPEIERDDVGDDGVHFAGGERDHGFLDVNVGMHGVSAMGLIFGGADLHAPEAAAGVEDEVVAVGVSPGLGDAEAEVDGFAHKGEFGHFSAAFGRVGVPLVGGGAGGFSGHSTSLQNPAQASLDGAPAGHKAPSVGKFPSCRKGRDEDGATVSKSSSTADSSLRSE